MGGWEWFSGSRVGYSEYIRRESRWDSRPVEEEKKSLVLWENWHLPRGSETPRPLLARTKSSKDFREDCPSTSRNTALFFEGPTFRSFWWPSQAPYICETISYRCFWNLVNDFTSISSSALCTTVHLARVFPHWTQGFATNTSSWKTQTRVNYSLLRTENSYWGIEVVCPCLMALKHRHSSLSSLTVPK